MLEWRSALHEALKEKVPGGEALKLGEVPLPGLLQAAGFPSARAAFEKALAALLGVKPSAKVGAARVHDDRLILRTGPEQVWIVAASNSGLLAQLSAAIPPAVGAVTDLTHSRSRIFIEGALARDVLAKGIPLDLYPDVFKIGQFALTGVHHTPVLLYRSGADRYELWAMRTFARSVWDWLTDAAMPFGYTIAEP